MNLIYNKKTRHEWRGKRILRKEFSFVNSDSLIVIESISVNIHYIVVGCEESWIIHGATTT